MGRFEESIEAGRRTLEIDPLSPGAYNELGFALDLAGRGEEALELYREGKEDLRHFWGQPSEEAARRHLDGWIGRARATGIKQLEQMANTLSIHRKGLLAYYDVPITTGPLEGTNNKIQLLKRKSYGFRDKEFFKLKIYALHETRLELVG